jgi:flavin-dependent dehydrogenase
MSLGVVIGKEFLPKFGATKEEQYDNMLRQDSVLNKVAGDAKRLTPVMEYTNYQLVSERVVGDGWALAGDTGGFIDPVFSSGMQIGMKGAVQLAAAIQKNTAAAFQRYQRDIIHHLKCWHEIAESFYDGRLFTSFNVGQMLLKKHWIMRLFYPYISNQFGKIFTGAASDSDYSLGLMRFVVNYGAQNEDPSGLRIN